MAVRQINEHYIENKSYVFVGASGYKILNNFTDITITPPAGCRVVIDLLYAINGSTQGDSDAGRWSISTSFREVIRSHSLMIGDGTTDLNRFAICPNIHAQKEPVRFLANERVTIKNGTLRAFGLAWHYERLL